MLLNTGQNIYLVVLWITLSITCLVMLNTFWEPSRRSVHNDVIGWQIAILGTIYAVMIGFMLYAVWNNFQTAETNANNEANNLVNLYRAADGLQEPQRDLIQQTARAYATQVITQEWPTMHTDEPGKGEERFGGHQYVMKLWAATTQTPTANLQQQASLRQVMIELSSMTEHRRIRLLESRTKMPNILWGVLVMGGMITIASSCLIGSENVPLHFVLIISLSLLVSLALVAIGDIDRPFQGSVHVSSTAFQQAEDTMMQPMSPTQ
ncbi:MAG TPA: DUF4239 domain-containing protein [Acidobacteriaceae bacterium]|nr:DUF4239 domain-containing protein [Acidobacteriaceae bacterium]